MNKALMNVVKNHIHPNDIVLDVGCGDKKYSTGLACKEIITLDAWDKTQPDILLDLEVADLPFEDKSVDVILMLDFIEHLDRARGYVILEQAKRIVRKKIILTTPLWWTDNADNVESPDLWCYGNIYDYHKSFWRLRDFSGWNRILGIHKLDDHYLGIYKA